MVRLATVAAWVGVLTGVWVILVAYAMGEHWAWPTPALAVVLILASVVSMLGPRETFYASGALAILLCASTAIGSARDATENLTLGLGVVSFVLSLVAARREGRVSEQSHPMNLPVFG